MGGKGGAMRSPAPHAPSPAQLLGLALLKPMMWIYCPFGRLLALHLWAGRTLVGFAQVLERMLVSLVGWLSGGVRGGRQGFKLLGFTVRRIHVLAAATASGALLAFLWRQVVDSQDDDLQQRKLLRQKMRSATSYDEWHEVAEQLSLMGPRHSRWARRGALDKQEKSPTYLASGASRLFDRDLLVEKIDHLHHLSNIQHVRDIIFALRIDLLRNVANIASSRLHDKFLTVPGVIQSYLQSVKERLSQIVEWPESHSTITYEEKLSFFHETRHTFGRTALLLSGGGGLGTFHLGVCKALFTQGLLPRVLAGSSAGSICCALMATRTDRELHKMFTELDAIDFGFFSNTHAGEAVQHLIETGSLHDIAHLIKKLRILLGDLTFLEAYERTGRILNVTVSPADTNEPPRLLNYLTAPQALVWSAVAASSAFPGLYPAQHLLARNSVGEVMPHSAGCGGSERFQRRWRDGSLELDLPTKALGEIFNCNHFVVSQTNPHIVPLLNFKKSLPSTMGDIFEAEFKHRCQVTKWLLPNWFPSKWIMLFTQPWEGDITLTLPSSLLGLSRTFFNPNEESFLHSVHMGEMSAWEMMSAIKCNCTIEATLDECVQKLMRQQPCGPKFTGAGKADMKGRIPSWLHVPAGSSGMSHVASWGNDIGSLDLPKTSSWGGHGADSLEYKKNHTGSTPAKLSTISSGRRYTGQGAALSKIDSVSEASDEDSPQDGTPNTAPPHATCPKPSYGVGGGRSSSEPGTGDAGVSTGAGDAGAGVGADAGAGTGDAGAGVGAGDAGAGSGAGGSLGAGTGDAGAGSGARSHSVGSVSGPSEEKWSSMIAGSGAGDGAGADTGAGSRGPDKQGIYESLKEESVLNFPIPESGALPGTVTREASRNAPKLQDIIALAQMDCWDESVRDDLWSQLLPLTLRGSKKTLKHSASDNMFAY